MAMLCFDRLRWPWNLTEKGKGPPTVNSSKLTPAGWFPAC